MTELTDEERQRNQESYGVHAALIARAARLAIVVAVVLGLASFALLQLHESRVSSRQLACSLHIRSILGGLNSWSEQHDGQYPLPSVLDADDATVRESGPSKDHSANLLSILIFNGLVSPQQLVCPEERNRNIAADSDYQMTRPQTAVRPDSAQWDPGFCADFNLKDRRGNTSYAHALPGGSRLAMWQRTFQSTEAIVGDRGPTYQGTARPTRGRWTLTNDAFGIRSKTLAMHGRRTTWEGSIGYNDGHVSFETKPDPDYVTYQRSVPGRVQAVPTPDNLFVDETDDSVGTNAFLSIFRTAGPSAADFEAIWD